jgi:4-amino-4-deoxy-L-arabinose transferase-like glycosyltransferase
VDAVYVGILILYMLAGMMVTPFHGDEPAIIHMTKDYYRMFHRWDIASQFYSDTFTEMEAQDAQGYRLENGVITKYTVGMMLSALGVRYEDLNYPWFWDGDWQYNIDLQHMPKPVVFFASRYSSMLLTMLSVAILFVIGRWLGGRLTAYIATFIYATMPAVLIFGRRGMFEGATLLATTLLIMVGLYVARRIQREGSAPIRAWVSLGVAAGFALASKHNLLFIIVPLFVALPIFALLRRRDLVRMVRDAVVAGVVALAVFFALNPTWWNAPLKAPGEVVRLRTRLLSVQIPSGAAYNGVMDQIAGLIRLPASAAQYYEIKRGWSEWLVEPIRAYEATPFTGIAWDAVGIVVYPLLFIGIIAALATRRGPHLVFVIVALFVAAAHFVFIPMAWQRYYLPLTVIWAVAISLGVEACRQLALRWPRAGQALAGKRA